MRWSPWSSSSISALPDAVDFAPGGHEDTAMPRDGFGREIDYLRISLIDQCNLRCVYCMPAGAQAGMPSSALLTPDEIATVARVAVSLGFRKIRLTGGEPTLRADLIEIVRAIAGLPGLGDLSLTTNAIRLPPIARALAAAGLRRVNVHLDALDPGRVERLMRGARAGAIWAGIRAAEDAGLTPIKLNCVVTRDYNDEDVVPLAMLTMEHPWHVRFIETMPLGTGIPAAMARAHFVPTHASRRRIEGALGPLTLQPAHDPSDEARNFRLPNALGIVGFISPVSEPYCGTCNRMRLTANGRFHLCLLNDDELDVRATLRRGGSDADVAAVLLRAVAGKPSGHRLDSGQSVEQRQMFQLGG
jgi:cyclic pyranopterin phosphate synthase